MNTPASGSGRGVGSGPRRTIRGGSCRLRRSDPLRTSRPDRVQQRRGLDGALARLGGRVGIGHHAAAHAQPDVGARELEGPDGHAQLQPGHRRGEADGARVCLAARALQLGDHVLGGDLGRARDRAGREARAQQVGVARACRAARPRPRKPGARHPRVRAPARGRPRSRCPAGRRAPGRCASGPRSSCSRPGPSPSASSSPGSSERGRVPLIGAVRTRRPRRSRNSSGERLATATPPAPPTNAARSGASAFTPAANRSSGSPSSRDSSRRHTLAWNRSPAWMRSRAAATASSCPPGPGTEHQGPVANGRGSATRARSSASRAASASARSGVHRHSNHHRPSASRRTRWS